MIGALVDGEGLTWVHDVMIPLSVGRVGSNQWSESLTIEMLEVILAMQFSIVILNEYTSSYPQFQWVDWKDINRKQMKSEGDNWSMTTLSGDSILECLKNNNIDQHHLVQWKSIKDTIYRVSLPKK